MSAAQSIRPGWLKLSDAPRYCGLSATSLKRARRAGKFEVRKAGGATLVNTDSLDAWIRSEEWMEKSESTDEHE